MSWSVNLVGLSYAWIRAQAREYAAAEPDQATVTALVHLDAPDEEHRMLAGGSWDTPPPRAWTP